MLVSSPDFYDDSDEFCIIEFNNCVAVIVLIIGWPDNTLKNVDVK